MNEQPGLDHGTQQYCYFDKEENTEALSWDDAGNDMPYEDHTKRLLKSKKRTRANDSNQIYKSHNIKFLKGYVLIESNLNVLLTYS